MGFNPLQEKGIPIEQQFLNWPKLEVEPYNKNEVHPYTRTRIILMNGIEVAAALFLHEFHRHTDDVDLKRKLAATRRIEQQQQKLINWLLSPEESPLETTIGYEQVAVDLTAWLARTEPDPNVKAALDFAMLEDFDHLYRYANLLELREGKQAEKIVGNLTEIMPGRPTLVEHRHPFDSIRRHYDNGKADILTKLHVLTIIAGEQQTMNYYMNVGPQLEDEIGRGLYQEIAMIEEQHVTHYGSLEDPRPSWLEMLCIQEYNQCYMYYSCMTSEVDERIKGIWQLCLEQEIEHLHIACDLIRQYEKRDIEATLPNELPKLTIFQPNKEYVRNVLANQIDLTTRDLDYIAVEELPEDSRYFKFQDMVNGDGFVPSQRVIEENIAANGRDYRLETEGPHPVEWLRSREEATV